MKLQELTAAPHDLWAVFAEMENGPDDHRVNLKQKVPVYIVYFTTFMRDGRLYFGNDLYDRDDALVKTIASAAAGDSASAQAVQTLRKSRAQ